MPDAVFFFTRQPNGERVQSRSVLPFGIPEEFYEKIKPHRRLERT
jgi:hypothetical protein